MRKMRTSKLRINTALTTDTGTHLSGEVTNKTLHCLPLHVEMSDVTTTYFAPSTASLIYSYNALNEFADIFARYLTAEPETQESKVSYSKKEKRKKG